ncbi:MAG: hypothetical protein Q27BB25_19285 [Blastomonas sp. CACIA14H2]|jgi:hypothetical protein|uniref:hypothetical protein n=1 Tax=unclassified Blastomonas TaxID=2626550 RepID=UPI0003CF9CC1|nr:hypothetical protein [Blastomonas sp. UPD001]ESZ85443.1 MAG: hypothetical protein Q27BB25_19285 [Blastomonas sp. CACIA14H2]
MKAVVAVALIAPLALTGCVASAVGSIVTAPVKIVSKGVDLATTSQSEADENRGRAMRKAEERLGKLQRQRDKALRKCDDGDDEACELARDIQEQIDEERDRVM